MIRKTTWIVLVVFVVLLAAVLLMQRTQGTVRLIEEEITPSATTAPRVLADLKSEDIVAIEWTGEGQALTLTQAADGSWALGPGAGGPVEASQIDQLRASLVSLRAVSQVGAGNPLDAIGLTVPANIIILRTAAGEQLQLNLGSPTPTGSGYYVQLGANPPVVVDKYEMDSILDLVQPSFWATPTPLPVTPGVTGTATP